MKYKTKNGHEIILGNPNHLFDDHLDGAADRIRTISTAATSLAAVALLAPSKGNRVNRRLELVAGKTASAATALAAGATVVREVRKLRRSKDGPAFAEDFGTKYAVPQIDDSLESLRLRVLKLGEDVPE